MTDKRFTMNELVNGDYSIDDTTYKTIYNEKHTFYNRICNVHSKKEATNTINLLNTLHEENQRLKIQLSSDENEGVCPNCKHHYLIKKGKYYVLRCLKAHEEASKTALRYCDDFEVKK